MDVIQILALVKARLGITAAVRDTYLAAIVYGVVRELEHEKGIALDSGDANHLMFCVDLATWRYQSRDSDGSMPRHLQYRLHNLMIHSGGGRP
ncbi:hypothetical protein P4U99_03585 [Brevibacillus agri]|uniref:hypothetical protein n=1 Tax=Brevibacillus agri TaxID=51101 RepID=UPI0018CE2F55|nr:hypothetical protein [Brevibacillus agri]MBG9567562.1 hypothetical protein [Brevibacillus agri]MBG9567595.1 hypothetical protein [Brevibacillus agri]MED1642301.1 hypothetical protein [Brevibacillus agri]MED1657718.1 hypothetical protein [Brevibacillus agri]MED1689475.1 hypothetical protein [Brevibacillus agri]